MGEEGGGRREGEIERGREGGRVVWDGDFLTKMSRD